MCKRQLRSMGSIESEIAKNDTEVWFIVPHERCRTAWWRDQLPKAKGKRAIRILADPGFLASCRWGVAFQMRIHTDSSNTPGTFIVDKKGILRWSHIGKGKRNWSDRPAAKTVLQQVKGLK